MTKEGDVMSRKVRKWRRIVIAVVAVLVSSVVIATIYLALSRSFSFVDKLVFTPGVIALIAYAFIHKWLIAVEEDEGG